MGWPLDEAKLGRVRDALVESDLDALVCRAPDNLLYLTNYWCMKGYDAVVFPREGDPTLVVIEPQLADAERTSWTSDIRLFAGYDERDHIRGRRGGAGRRQRAARRRAGAQDRSRARAHAARE